MKYECPSCKLQWWDDQEPKELLTFPLCIFCSLPHNEKELLNWQMNQLSNISSKNFPFVINRLYRYFETKLNQIEEKLDEIIRRENDDSGGGQS